MRIAISGMFWREPTVGSGQYLHALLDALARVAPEHEYVLLLPANDHRPSPALSGAEGITDQRFEAESSFVVRRSSFVVRTPFDGRSKNLAKLWYEQIG